MKRIKVAVGLSGGVDSAVSALLLKRAGCEVVGVHLYCWPPKSEIEKDLPAGKQIDATTRAEWLKKNGCRADEDRASALKTALELEIPFKVLDFSEEYNSRVIEYFYREYEEGRTPNPDVLCNSQIKFGLFLDWALKNGFDYIATGHYVKIERTQEPKNSRNQDEELSLLIPRDKHKDQTYFLWKLTQDELSRVLFPLGDLLKDEVRKIAKEAGLSVADKKDSQGICFVGNVEVREFLARRLKVVSGKVLDIEGNEVGTHDGVWFYTVGQRGGWTMDSGVQKKVSQSHSVTVSRGYGVTDPQGHSATGPECHSVTVSRGYGVTDPQGHSATGPECHRATESQVGRETPIYYVISKNAERNELVVGEADEAVENHFKVGEINWINGLRPTLQGDSLKLNTVSTCHGVTEAWYVRIRHGGELLRARTQELPTTSRLREAGKKSRNQVTGMCVLLDKAVRGIASGQSAVFYSQDGECLGGGVIQ